MSKIAANDTYGGNLLRKAIDYFCHLAVAPEFLSRIEKGDMAFAASEFLPKMRWLKDVNDDLYDPSYTDMLRVAFTSEFRRGKLQDLVALLSGRNFETKQYEEAVAEEAFAKLKAGVLNFINKTHFDRLTMILRSAGFVTSNLIRSQNAINFAYILYLRGRAEGMPAADIERLVRRWYVMSLLRGRYSGSPETAFDFDIDRSRRVALHPIARRWSMQNSPRASGPHCSRRKWTPPRHRAPTSGLSGCPGEARGPRFLSRDITVRDLLLNRSDVPPRLPAQPPEKAGHGAWALQPDRQLRSRAKRDQYRHRRSGARSLLRRAGRPMQRRREEVRRHHGKWQRCGPISA